MMNLIVLPVCMNDRTNNEDYVLRLRSKILQSEFKDSLIGRRIFERNLRSDEDCSNAIFDPLFLDPSYRRVVLGKGTCPVRLAKVCPRPPSEGPDRGHPASVG